MPRPILTCSLAVLTCCLISCSGGPRAVLTREAGSYTPPPTLDQLQAALLEELARLGIDPDRVVSRAPDFTGASFDLVAAVVAAGDPTGVELSWTYHNAGDYDQSGEVDIADIAFLSSFWLRTVAYDDPATRGGVTIWPSGQFEDDGGVEPQLPPAKGSGAENWRMAQVDGDSNGQINLADITPLGRNFGVLVSGYQIYRKLETDSEFVQIGFVPLVVSPDPSRPLKFTFFDTLPVGELSKHIEYSVRPYDQETIDEGPDSNIAVAGESGSGAAPSVEMTAEPTTGQVPLTVAFSAAATVDPSRSVVRHEWDFDDDGVYDLDSGTTPTAEYTYEDPGTFVARVRVQDSAGATAIDGAVIAVGAAPIATIEATPEGGEVPVLLTLDGRRSFTPNGDIVRYEWDLDGDGTWELDRGPISALQQEVTAPATRIIGLKVTDELGLTATTDLELVFTDDYEEQEPNDLPESATAIPLPAAFATPLSIRGNIGNGGYDGSEVDWYALVADKASMATFELTTSGPGVDLEVDLIDSDTLTVMHRVASLDGPESFTRGLRGAGTFYLRVRNMNTPTGLHYDYSAAITLAPLVLDETENNDSAAQADDLGSLETSINPGLWGNLGPGGTDGDNTDWYRFTLPQGDRMILQMDFFHHLADLELALYNSGGSVLYGVSEGVSNRERIEIELGAGAYSVRCYRREGGSANYELAIIHAP